jgi:peptidoglycan/xylan/chitin deacetylase (PgdA/CDA1 family)
MKYLRRKDYRSVAFEDLENHFLSGRPLSPHPIIISFDDGYADTFTHAYPILKQLGFTATVFLVSDYIGKKSEWVGCNKDGVSPLLTRENIWTMMADGFHFGSHGRTHKNLTFLPEEEAKTEVKKSKKDLENLLQRTIGSFSYPYGDFNKKVIEIVKEAGFAAARAVHNGNIHCKEDILKLRCVKINGVTPKYKYKFYLTGLYHWEQIWKERRKKKKDKKKGYFAWQAERDADMV